MRFFVRRSSDLRESDKPCDEAAQGTYIAQDDGVASERIAWFLDIDTLARLWETSEKYGDLIISPSAT